MADSGLTISQKRRGRRLFLSFSVLNTFSFQLLSGNIITLYALRLGATSAFIGLISSFVYISFFFLLVGKRLVPRFGPVRVFGFAWLGRYLIIGPIILTPSLAAQGRPTLVFAVLALSVFFFHAFRGVGIVSHSPIIGSLSEGKDRGSFLARFQITTHLMLLSSGVLIALVLGKNAPLSRYSIFIISGMILGILASMVVFRFPESRAMQEGASRKLLISVLEALKNPSFRKFIGVFAVISFVAGTARPFLIVFVKQAYNQSDQAVMFFVVIGSFGAVLAGLFTRKILDRIGAKPLYVMYVVLLLFSFTFPVLSPRLEGVEILIFLGGMFFLFTLSAAGEENAAQNYFYALSKPEEQLNLGVLYFLVFGTMGAAGSFLGGVVIEGLYLVGVETPREVFRFFFIALAGILCIAVVFMTRLERLGAFSMKNALGVMFSLRDLRAITLLNKLDKSTSIAEEQKVIQAIGSVSSEVPIDELLKKLNSPSLTIRSETLYALEKLPTDSRISRALVDHVQQHEFTTAHIAARIIGLNNLKEGITVMRNALGSEDYLLAAQSMIALARLNDRASIERISLIMKSTANPRLQTHGAASFRIFRYMKGIPLLFDLLRRENAPPFLRDEIIFSLAGLAEMGDWFYPSYIEFLEDSRDGISLLEDRLMKLDPVKKQPFAGQVKNVLTLFTEDKGRFESELSALFADLPANVKTTINRRILVSAAAEEALIRFERFAFFFCALLVKFVEIYEP